MTTDQTKRRGLLIILSSPSGAGKSTLATRLRSWDQDIAFSVSATTRTARPGEVDGQHYHFTTEAEFKTMVADGEMLEHAHVFGHFYGSPQKPVEQAIDGGHDVLFDIDWQGAQQIQNSALSQHVLSSFILPPSITELRRRLEGRGQDSAEVIAGRMQKSMGEISHWAEYDYVVINDDGDECFARVCEVLDAERMRRTRQTGLIPFVRELMG